MRTEYPADSPTNEAPQSALSSLKVTLGGAPHQCSVHAGKEHVHGE